MALGTFFSLTAMLLSIFTLLFSLSSSVSVSYFIIVVSMHKCLGKHSFIAILNGTCSSFRENGAKIYKQSAVKLNYKLNLWIVPTFHQL